MRKGRRERIEKGSRERIEKGTKKLNFFSLYISGPAMQPLFLQVLRVELKHQNVVFTSL